MHEDVAANMHDMLFTWLQETDARIPEKNPYYREADYRKFILERQERQLRKQEEARLDMLSLTFSPNADWWGSIVTTND